MNRAFYLRGEILKSFPLQLQPCVAVFVFAFKKQALPQLFYIDAFADKLAVFFHVTVTAAADFSHFSAGKSKIVLKHYKVRTDLNQRADRI